jgi:hypothetical protein
MAVDIIENASQVLLGTFMAHAVYGGEYIQPAFDIGGDDDAEKADDYRGYLESVGDFVVLDDTSLPGFDDMGGDAKFTGGGLYNARVEFTDTFDAQGLLAVENGNRMVLTFRGTDGKDPALTGQTFTGEGLASHYEAFAPLIDAAYDYLAAHPEITEVVISGHSLGGALVDVFTLVDAARFRALRPDGLTIVSLGSSGLPEDLDEHLDGIGAFVTPDDYISIANTEDRAHFPDDFPDFPEDVGLVPIFALKDNLHLGADLVFNVPNIRNRDVEYSDPVDNPLTFRGLGAEHNSALIWANVQGLISDPLFEFYQSQNLVAGVTDYTALPDYDGEPISLFKGYEGLGDPDDDNDRGDKALTGRATADYIYGMTGNDRIVGRGGDDLLSGGDDNDIIIGGKGNDILAGGLGGDQLSGGTGTDWFFFDDIQQSITDGRDSILDFELGVDKIAVSSIDAEAGATGDQAFAFIGVGAFTGEGQIRATQRGDNTILYFNTDGAGGAEMKVVLRGVDADNLTDLDFIL